MSSSLKSAVCSALLALSIAACDSGSSEAGKGPRAKVRLQLDVERSRVWLLTEAGVAIYDAAAPDRVLRVQVPGWIFAGEPYGCLPALALGPQGEAVISSDVAPVLWRVDPETLAVTRHTLRLDIDTDKDVGFTVLSYLRARGAYLAVSSRQGTLWRIDRALGTAHRLARRVPRENDCGVRALALIRQFGLQDE